MMVRTRWLSPQCSASRPPLTKAFAQAPMWHNNLHVDAGLAHLVLYLAYQIPRSGAQPERDPLKANHASSHQE